MEMYALWLEELKVMMEDVAEKGREALDADWLTDKEHKGLADAMRDMTDRLDDAECAIKELDAALFDLLGGE